MTALPHSEPLLLVQTDGPVATLTLNRPAERNALSRALMADLIEALAGIAANPSVRVVVLAANGPAFCAGHDLKELRANRAPGFLEGLFQQCSALMTAIVRLPQPVIAKVHGIATAAGCQLVASCDLAVASSAARFATPGVNIGLFCSTPMVALSRNLGRKQAMEMLLTGEAAEAETARALGLVNRVAPPEALDEAVDELAARIASKSGAAVRIGKEAFYAQAEMPLDAAYAYASAVMARNMGLDDAAEGIEAFIEKRHPQWKHS